MSFALMDPMEMTCKVVMNTLFNLCVFMCICVYQVVTCPDYRDQAETWGGINLLSCGPYTLNSCTFMGCVRMNLDPCSLWSLGTKHCPPDLISPSRMDVTDTNRKDNNDRNQYFLSPSNIKTRCNIIVVSM